jgi:hypothetical protein
MTVDLSNRIAELSGASSAKRRERVQSVWSGYGEITRYELTGASVGSVVVKHVTPPKGSGRSHDRKLRSYEVERTWYQDWSGRCDESCRVPRCLHAERDQGEWLFVLEDLDAAGFAGRRHDLSNTELDSCLRWLASFHATFLSERPRGLWKVGTYWHLGTRPDEHRSMKRGPLRNAAAAIDARLSGTRFPTLVHGDAKPANFCFSRDGKAVAAVDFQYVGGGCPMKDIAYLLTGEDRRTTNRALDVYFRELGRALNGRDVDAAAIEADWRELFPWAWADFHRFLDGWAPHHHVHRHGDALTRQVLTSIGR